MTTFPIRDDNDLARAVDLVDQLWGAAPGTPQAEALEIMSERVHTYEAKARARALPPADPRKLIAFKLRELGLSQRELARRLGWGAGRLSEVISGKRALTLNMVRELAPTLGIDAGLLVHDVHEADDGASWVRLPAELVAQAAAVENGGCGSLQELVEQAVEAVLERVRVAMPNTMVGSCTSLRPAGFPPGVVPFSSVTSRRDPGCVKALAA